MSAHTLDIHPQFLVDDAGERHAVQLSVAEFDALMEVLEDYLDGQALDRAVDGAEGFSDFADVAARLKAQGKL